MNTLPRHNLIASVLSSLMLIACGTVPIEALPDTFSKDAPDVDDDIAIDINLDIQFGDTGQGDVKKDIDPNAKELCNNGIDDNGDGRVDENCWPAPNLRADETWYDFGTIAIGGSESPARSFDAPTKGEGLVLVARDITAGQKAYVWLEQLKTPGGLQVIGTGDQWATSFNRTGPEIAGATALIGESPAVIVSSGTWNFGFVRALQPPWAYGGVPDKGFLQVGLVSRPDNSDKAAVLDLDVFLVGGTTGMTPDAFGKSVQWQQIRAKVEKLWGSQNPMSIKLGDVQFFAIDGDDGVKFKYLDNVLAGDDSNELTAVYKVTGAIRPKSTAATLVIVSGIDDKGLSVAAGLSQLAGINGQAGSRVSGMAMAIDAEMWAVALAEAGTTTTAGDVWGVILAHELGHFLGLWHTDEHDGSLHDPLIDTPECDFTDQTLTPELCKASAKNLMFWSPDNQGKPLNISGDQHTVARRSVVLHPAP
jgi:hypothetical protein